MLQTNFDPNQARQVREYETDNSVPEITGNTKYARGFKMCYSIREMQLSTKCKCRITFQEAPITANCSFVLTNAHFLRNCSR